MCKNKSLSLCSPNYLAALSIFHSLQQVLMAESPRCFFTRSDGINDFLLSSLHSERSTNLCLNLSAFMDLTWPPYRLVHTLLGSERPAVERLVLVGKLHPQSVKREGSVRAHSKGEILTNTSHNPPLFGFRIP